MKTRKIITILVLAILICVKPGFSQEEQEPREPLTHEEFAVELVKNLHLDGQLPTAALAGDCIDLLERIGIAPLSGWEPKANLSEEDYLVVIAKAHGKEDLLHKRAMAVEEKNVDIINKKWQESYDKTGRWVSLDELLKDKSYFPDGDPQSPYKLEYEDRNNDHKADPHFLPIVSLMKFRELLSNQ